MAFKPYFDRRLGERIETPEENYAVWHIRHIGTPEDFLAYIERFKLDLSLNPSMRQEPIYRIKMKALLEQKHRFLKEAARRRKRAGTPSLTDAIGAIMEGMIIGDEFAVRFLGRKRR